MKDRDQNQNEDDLTNDQDKLRFENELKKMKLSLERGASFSDLSSNKNLPPEVENRFLKNIEAFEDAFQSAKQISVYDFIGRPEFLSEDRITDQEISDALKNIVETLNEYGIILDTLCEVDDRVLYQFITEELFLHEMDDIRIEGMVSHFIYEEFHPNHEYDLTNATTEFINDFLDKTSKDFYTSTLTREAETDQQLIDFRSAFASFNVGRFEIDKIAFDEGIAQVEFTIDFSGMIENSHVEQRYVGKGKMEFLHQYGFWYINRVNFPSIS